MKLIAASALVGTAMAGTMCAANFGIPSLFNCKNRNSETYFKKCLYNKLEGQAEKSAAERQYDTFHLVEVKEGVDDEGNPKDLAFITDYGKSQVNACMLFLIEHNEWKPLELDE